MKTAKEMFKELEFIIKRKDEEWLIYEYKHNNSYLEIGFPLKSMKWQYWGNCPITVKRHNAIHQQMKELGWLDE